MSHLLSRRTRRARHGHQSDVRIRPDFLSMLAELSQLDQLKQLPWRWKACSGSVLPDYEC